MKKKGCIIGGFLLSISIFLCFLIYASMEEKPTKKIVDADSTFKGFSFNEIETLDYGNYSLKDMIHENIICNDKCYYLNKEIKYSISEVEGLGKQSIIVKINYEGQEYSHLYEIEIKDETAPVIELINEDIELLIGDKFNPLDYIKSIEDNYDTDLENKVNVENKVDINKAGEYTVSYTIEDSNGNSSTKELKVIVKEEAIPEITTTTPVSTTTNSSSTTSTTTKKVTTTDKVTTPSTNAKNTFKDNINSVKLNSIKTRNKTLDSKIDKIVADINKKNSTNYDKLLAAYDYVMNYLDYEMVFLWGNAIYDLMDEYGYNYNDAHEVLLALNALNDKTGVCDSYAALFMIIARNLGFDAYVLGGQVKSVSGGTTGHAWVTVKANGTYYLFDPQIEDSKNGKQRLVYFGKTDKELNLYTYDRSACIKKFNFFKELPKASSTVEITGGANAKEAFDFKGYNETRYPSSISVQKDEVLNIKVSASGVSKYNFKIYYYDEDDSSSRKVLASSSSKDLELTINCNDAGKMRLEIEVEETVNGRKYMIYYPVNVIE